ncbi:MAG: glycosyltransferase family 4 protein [Chitinophagaceae bacterium]
MKLILSHLTGNANVKAAAAGFTEAQILSGFYVSMAAFPGSVLHRMGALGPFSEVRRRSFDPKLRPFVKSWPILEIGRLFAYKSGISSLTKAGGIFNIDQVCQNLDKRVASGLKTAFRRGANAVYAYEDVAGYSFSMARSLGMLCLYDLPIGYWRAAHQLLDVERQKWPEWISTLPGFSDSEFKLARKDEELTLADRIFVASSFTAKTLEYFPGHLAPVEVIPYGFPPVTAINRLYPKLNKRLKLLFVGSLSQRKGIANLFEAVKDFGAHIELTLVGSKTGGHCPALDAALNSHRWIPSLSHDEVLKLMRESDVLVFPSLFEGFGLVITEAMSQGTPVITTDRTAGPDLITDGHNGWLIEAGSTDALKASIEEILARPSMIAENGKAALETARRRPWEDYGRELAMAVSKVIRRTSVV